jgi:hypothetical protein
MLAVVDPYLLHVDEPNGIGLPARDTLADLVLLLARKGIAIPEDATYWRALVHDFLAPLTHRIGNDHQYKQPTASPAWAAHSARRMTGMMLPAPRSALKRRDPPGQTDSAISGPSLPRSRPRARATTGMST